MTISNQTYALLDVTLPATSATYDLSPVDTNGNVFEKVYLDVDATNGDVIVNLPDISIFGRVWNFQVVINRIDNSMNSVTVNAFSSLVPLVQQYIGSATSTQVGTRYSTITCSPTTDNGWSAEVTGGGSVSIPATVAGLDQATLALAQYVDLPIGTVLMVDDYNVTGFGCAIVKTTVANGDFQDWFVLSTEAAASTGGIGNNPI